MCVCVCVCVCVYVCLLSVVETELYTHPWAPEGVRLGLVAMGVFGSTYVHWVG